MIYVRDDDILLGSSEFDDPFKKFQQVHRWICGTTKLLHVPTILVTEIQEFPDCIAYIREETKEGRMQPEIHGFKHIDYGKLTKEEVIEHLNICKDFLYEEFDRIATKFYTPWGGNSSLLREASSECNLQLVDCSDINKLNGRYGIMQRIKDGENPEVFLENKEVFYHWWQGGLRLKRLAEVLKHGSLEKAKEADRELFKD